MRYLTYLLLFLPLTAFSQISESVQFLDNFNRTTDSLSQSGSPHTNWVRLANQTPVTGDVRADGTGGTAQSGMANGEAGIVVYDSLVTSDSLAIRFIWKSPSNAPGTVWAYNDQSVYLRMNTTDKATWDGWQVAIGGWYTASAPNRVYVYINRVLNGVETNYSSPAAAITLANNDTVRVWNIGDTIKVYQNQTLIHSYYSATFAPTTGYVGLGMRKYTTSAIIDDFSIGKATAVSVTPPATDIVAPTIVYASQEPFGLKPNDSLAYRVDATDAFTIKKIVWTSNGSLFDSVTYSTPLSASASFTSKKRVFASVGTYTWSVTVTDSAGNATTQTGQHSVDTVAAVQRDSTKKIIAYVPIWGLDLTVVGGPSGGNYRMPIDSLDFDAIDYFTLFHAYIDLPNNRITGLSGLQSNAGMMKAINDWIHTNRPGKASMISFGGAGATGMNPFLQTTATVDSAVRICLKWVDSVKYDGFDFDPEPAPTAGLKTNMTSFFRKLRDSLNTRTPLYNSSKKHILTAVVDRSVSNVASHSLWDSSGASLDFIGTMSYDMYWGDWQKTWHNNAAYAGAGDLTPWNTPNYSVANLATTIRPHLGIAKSKYSLGIDFNGYLFNGNVPRLNGYNGAPISPADGIWSVRHYYGSGVLSQITSIGSASGAPGKGGSQEYWRMRRYILDTLSPGNLKFDNVAKGAHIELNGPGQASDRFGSVPDTANHTAIVQLSSDSGYGAIFIWDITAGYLNRGAYPTAPSGIRRDFMLQNIKEKFYGTGASPAPAPLPTAPSLSSPAAGATGVSNQDIQFTWNSVAAATKYRIRLSEFVNFANPALDDSTTNLVYQFTSTGAQGSVPPLKQNTVYYWGVASINAQGQGADSTRSFTTQTVTASAPSAPTLSAPADAATDQAVSITFSWLPVEGDTVTAHHFQLARNTGFTTLDVNDSSASSPKIVSFLQKGVTYYWRVRLKNEAGWGSYATYRTFTVASAPVVTNYAVSLLWRDADGRTRSDPPPWLPIAVTPDTIVSNGITADASYGAISSGGYTTSGNITRYGGGGSVGAHSHNAADITSGQLSLVQGGTQSVTLGAADAGRVAKKRFIVQTSPQTALSVDTIASSDLPTITAPMTRLQILDSLSKQGTADTGGDTIAIQRPISIIDSAISFYNGTTLRGKIYPTASGGLYLWGNDVGGEGLTFYDNGSASQGEISNDQNGIFWQIFLANDQYSIQYRGSSTEHDSLFAISDSGAFGAATATDMFRVSSKGVISQKSGRASGSDAFTTTATTDTVTITGAATTDLYFVTLTGSAAPGATDAYVVQATATGFVLHRGAAGTSGLTYNWFRIKVIP